MTFLPTVICAEYRGGYLGRNNDPPPGHQLIWQGYAALQFMSFGFALKEE